MSIEQVMLTEARAIFTRMRAIADASIDAFSHGEPTDFYLRQYQALVDLASDLGLTLTDEE